MNSESLLTRKSFNIHLLKNEEPSLNNDISLQTREPVQQISVSNDLLEQLIRIDPNINILDQGFPFSSDEKKIDIVASSEDGELIFINIFDELKIQNMNDILLQYNWAITNFNLLKHIFKSTKISPVPNVKCKIITKTVEPCVQTMLDHMPAFPLRVHYYKDLPEFTEKDLIIETWQTKDDVKKIEIKKEEKQSAKLTEEEINDFLDDEEEEVTESYNSKETPINKASASHIKNKSFMKRHIGSILVFFAGLFFTVIVILLLTTYIGNMHIVG